MEALALHMRYWWLENRRWRPRGLREEGSRLAMDVIHQCRQHGDCKCLSFFGLPEPLQAYTLSESRHTTGTHGSVPLGGYTGHL